MGATWQQDQAFGGHGDVGVGVDGHDPGEVAGEVAAELVASLLGDGLAAELHQERSTRESGTDDATRLIRYVSQV